MKHLRGITAGLAIAAAAITGITLATHHATPRTDTTLNASDTTWGTPATDVTIDVGSTGIHVELPPITPFDTTWG